MKRIFYLALVGFSFLVQSANASASDMSCEMGDRKYVYAFFELTAKESGLHDARILTSAQGLKPLVYTAKELDCQPHPMNSKARYCFNDRGQWVKVEVRLSYVYDSNSQPLEQKEYLIWRDSVTKPLIALFSACE